jgi:hypothetical protein
MAWITTSLAHSWLIYLTAKPIPNHRQPLHRYLTHRAGSSSPRHRLRRANHPPAHYLTGLATDPGLSPTLPGAAYRVTYLTPTPAQLSPADS